MAYEPTNWKSGDVVTSAKLNKLEQGVQDAGPLVINLVDDGGTDRLDKTWQEIYDAMADGKNCVVVTEDPNSVYPITAILHNTVNQTYDAYNSNVNLQSLKVVVDIFRASTPNDYPVFVTSVQG